jgi:hypothetical protein
MAAVAAILNERRPWSSKGTFLQSPPNKPQKNQIDPGICPIITISPMILINQSLTFNFLAELIKLVHWTEFTHNMVLGTLIEGSIECLLQCLHNFLNLFNKTKQSNE